MSPQRQLYDSKIYMNECYLHEMNAFKNISYRDYITFNCSILTMYTIRSNEKDRLEVCTWALYHHVPNTALQIIIKIHSKLIHPKALNSFSVSIKRK